MKKLVIFLTVALVMAFIGFASAQPYWPDPCDQNVINAEYSTFANRFPNDGVLRFPCLIAYMGYFDANGQWHWWTTETYPGCLYRSPEDNLPWNMFGDPNAGTGTAWLPMMAYGNPSGKPHHRYEYYWPSNSLDYTPLFSYYSDTTVHSPWGWYIRKTTYENGTSTWRLSFALSKTFFQPQCWWEPNIANIDNNPENDISWENNAAWGIVCSLIGTPPNQYVMKLPVTQLGQPMTWEDIDYVRIEEKIGTDYVEVQGLQLNGKVDDFLSVVGANFDQQRSWLTTTCPSNVPPFSCDVYVHETNATITGIEPKTGEIYSLVIVLTDGRQLRLTDWIVPVTMELEPVPQYTKKTITNVKGKVTTTGNSVPAIQFTEREDGSLLVQYIAPFIETEPPALQASPFSPNAWRGTGIRIGLANKPFDQVVDPSDPRILLWPNIPSNVGTVIFPKEFINRLKNSNGFTGTAHLSIQHRDQFSIKRWLTGDGSLTYQFKNPYPIP